MEEIDLSELFEFLKNKIILFVIIMIGVCLVGCAYGLFLQKPMYQSYTKVILGGNENGGTALTQSDVTLNDKLVGTYSEIAKSRRVLDRVIADLSLDYSYEQLSSQISVTAVNNTQVIKITASDREPVKAKNIANATASHFKDEVADLLKMNNVNILDEAIASAKPYNINVFKQFVLYLLIGMVASMGTLFLIFYFDRSVKSAEQVEQKLKLPILGSVKDMSKGGK